MSCRITSDGSVYTESGEPSVLYRDLLDNVLDQNLAQDLFALSETREFKENVVMPLKNRYKGNTEYFYPNGEINYRLVTKYMVGINEDGNALSLQERLSLMDTMSQFPQVENSYDLLNLMEAAFYDNKGLFNPTMTSLQSSLYTPYEARKIMDSIPLQESIKNSIENLKKTPEITNYGKEAPSTYSDKNTKINSWGKLESSNPWQNEKNLAQQYGGRRNLEQLVQGIESSSVQKNIQAVLEDLRSYKRLPALKIEDGALEPDVPVYFPTNAIKIVEDLSVINDLNLLLEIDSSLLQSEEALNYLSKIEKSLTNYGIDVIGLSKHSNYMEVVNPLIDFLILPNKNNTEALENAYADVFGKTKDQKQEVFQGLNQEQSLFYITGLATEQELFEKGYVATATNNVYQKVQLLTKQEMMQITNTEQATLDREAANMKGFSDNEVAQQAFMYKKHYGHPLEKSKTPMNLSSKMKNFTGNFGYLSTDFLVDFNVDMLKEKQKNSEKFKEFYSNFEITPQGLTLKYTDPLTIAKVKEWIQTEGEIPMAEDIAQYSLISKSMPSLAEESDNVFPLDKAQNRTLYSNNPDALSYTEKPFTYINLDNISMKNATEDFVKTPRGVYELIETRGNTSFYTRVPLNTSISYNDFTPITMEEIMNYSNVYKKEELPSTYSKKRLLYSKEELDKINSDNFDCQ